MRRTNALAWGLVGVLATVVMVGSGVLFVRFRPYWVAKNCGVQAHLAGVYLPGADLRRAALAGANLRGAVLRAADLREANFPSLAYFPGGAAGLRKGADLRHADLRRAKLRGANLMDVDLRSADLQDADLTGTHLSDARYDRFTHWPDGCDPPEHGAILVEGEP
jgi:hypothetical protein